MESVSLENNLKCAYNNISFNNIKDFILNPQGALITSLAIISIGLMYKVCRASNCCGLKTRVNFQTQKNKKDCIKSISSVTSMNKLPSSSKKIPKISSSQKKTRKLSGDLENPKNLNNKVLPINILKNKTLKKQSQNAQLRSNRLFLEAINKKTFKEFKKTLKNSPKPNFLSKDIQENNCLHLACSRKRSKDAESILKFLLKNNQSRDLYTEKNSNNQTALELLCSNSNPPLDRIPTIMFLKQVVLMESKKKQNLLNHICKNNNYDYALQLIIESGVQYSQALDYMSIKALKYMKNKKKIVGFYNKKKIKNLKRTKKKFVNQLISDIKKAIQLKQLQVRKR